MREHISRSFGPIVSAAMVGLFVVWGSGAVSAPPINSLAFAAVNQRPCGATPLCAADPAPDPGDQATAEQRIIDGYVKKQVSCTPDLAPNPQSVTWDPPGFRPNVGAQATSTTPIRDWAAISQPTTSTVTGTSPTCTANGRNGFR